MDLNRFIHTIEKLTALYILFHWLVCTARILLKMSYSPKNLSCTIFFLYDLKTEEELIKDTRISWQDFNNNQQHC